MSPPTQILDNLTTSLSDVVPEASSERINCYDVEKTSNGDSRSKTVAIQQQAKLGQEPNCHCIDRKSCTTKNGRNFVKRSCVLSNSIADERAAALRLRPSTSRNP